jgi:hypothetical protein
MSKNEATKRMDKIIDNWIERFLDLHFALNREDKK